MPVDSPNFCTIVTVHTLMLYTQPHERPFIYGKPHQMSTIRPRLRSKAMQTVQGCCHQQVCIYFAFSDVHLY